jgi:hydrogenase-4 membrane subunit HyfE
MKFSKVIVSLVIILNVFFTLGVLYVFLRTGNEPTSLVVAFFSFTTGELFMISTITKTKIKGEGEDEY